MVSVESASAAEHAHAAVHEMIMNSGLHTGDEESCALVPAETSASSSCMQSAVPAHIPVDWEAWVQSSIAIVFPAWI